MFEEKSRVDVFPDSLEFRLQRPEEPVRKLYITNFRGKVNRKFLKDTFSVYGQVIECRGPFTNVKKHKYAFITFLNPEHALKAFKDGRKKKVLFNNRPLRVVPSFSYTQPSENDIENILLKISKTVKKTHEKIPIQETKRVDQKIEGIDYLNRIDDDSLIHIFLYLPFIDRIRVERVCKRWQAVSERCWHDIKTLDLSKIVRSIKKAKKLKNVSFEKIIKRCGRFLTTLKFSTRHFGCNAEVLPAIGEHCKNITRLTLQLHKDSNKELAKVFAKVQKLQFLEIKDIRKYFKIENLILLPHDTIEEIRLSTLQSYNSFQPRLGYLGHPKAAVFRKLHNLRSLTLSGFILRPNHLKVVEKLSLTHLSLPNCSLKKIHNLTMSSKIQHLNFAKVLEISNDLLAFLALKYNELKYLNLSHCSSVSDHGILLLKTLRNLEVLILDEIYEVTDSALQGLVNLHELHCQNCDRVRDPGIITLIQTAHNLRFLNIFNTVCPMVLENWSGDGDSSPLLEIEAKDITVSDISDEFLYDDDDVYSVNIWDFGINDFDEYDDFDGYDDIYGMDEIDYNGENPFFIF
ncbi:uncharacterized protein LOC141536850 isoform X2 [Cotesia typhae]|uniref:uncharacterized protein LOC141536850 isoform X2 n=1 Tax=Cotesia typhae TaxID=2053667 RepID=UPI003D69E4EE